MKLSFGVMVSVAVLLLYGCATSSYSVGKDLASENVSQIIKGKTTSEELIVLIGEPYAKTVLSASDEKWIYMHSEGTTKAQSYIVSMDVKTTGTQKMVKSRTGTNWRMSYTKRGRSPINLSGLGCYGSSWLKEQRHDNPKIPANITGGHAVLPLHRPMRETRFSVRPG